MSAVTATQALLRATHDEDDDAGLEPPRHVRASADQGGPPKQQALSQLKHAREEILQRGIDGRDHRGIFDAYYGNGVYDALQNDGMQPFGVRLATPAVQYEFRALTAPGVYDKRDVCEVMDVGSNCQFKSANAVLVAKAIAFVATQKKWTAVKLEGESDFTAEVARHLKSHGIEVSLPGTAPAMPVAKGPGMSP